MRFSHTKTALCDRKDTQSHFAVNAARNIMCVGTFERGNQNVQQSLVSMPHAALYVSGRTSMSARAGCFLCFNAARNIVCVGTHHRSDGRRIRGIVSMPHAASCVSGQYKEETSCSRRLFQCRTQHYVCRDIELGVLHLGEKGFNAARGIMCVGTPIPHATPAHQACVSMPHATLWSGHVALRPCRSTSHFLLLYDSIRFVLFQ